MPLTIYFLFYQTKAARRDAVGSKYLSVLNCGLCLEWNVDMGLLPLGQ